MIRYALICENGHGFEGWFASSEAWESQLAAKQLECPSCGSAQIEKAPMAPSIAKGKGGAEADGTAKAAREIAKQVREHVEQNAEYVGDRFPEEARKIHYGEEESRGIYGEASSEEADELRDEGVEVYPLPDLPDDQN